MIRGVRLESYKGHRDTTIPRERFTVPVGANGVGKSSALQAVDDVGSLATQGTHPPLGRADALTLRRGWCSSTTSTGVRTPRRRPRW